MPESLPPEFEAAWRATADRRAHFGAPVHFFNETGSTNDVAAALADRGAPEGTTVIAMAQSAGRGRMGRTWFSPHGAGVYVSVVCRQPELAPLLTLAGGVAVAEGIRRATGLPCEIKWPNDIGPKGDVRRKLAGILAEATSGGGDVSHVILGFGINLQAAAYPQEIAWRATAIEAELGRPADGALVVAETLASLATQVHEIVSGEAASVLTRWRQLSPSASGTAIESDGRRGITAGIDGDGALLVRLESQLERVVSGEIRWM
jgi:BirA family biotin operon repressor/biotin-[acetyl-CoA-carboxylase] ligase